MSQGSTRSTVDGAVLRWTERGAGPPVVLIHGISECGRSWENQIDQFATAFRVIALDVRGFGSSAVGDGDGTTRQLADDLWRLVEASDGPFVDAERLGIVGFSMGGVIAQRFAVDHPELVGALVVASSSSLVGASGARWFLERIELARTSGLGALSELNRQDAELVAASLRPDARTRYVSCRIEGFADGRGYLNACRAMAGLRELPLTPELPRIRCPSLVITGELDPSCPPRASSIIAEQIPGAEMHILPGIGHLAHWEAPELFNETLRSFLLSTMSGSDR